jgi:hypothetical protein
MLRRHPNHSYLLVAQATGRPLALYRGLPRPERCIRAMEGATLVYDLGPLHAKDHSSLLAALTLLRGLSSDAPSALFVGGEPVMVIDPKGHEAKQSRGGGVLSLLASR